MTTIKSEYLGDLRTQATHVASSNSILTDAPVDNNGKGEAFSPTDLTCASLGSCMMTLMGIAAKRDEINLKGSTWETTKTMQTDPRRIAKIEIKFNIKADRKLTDSEQEKYKKIAHHCPVALSLHPDIKQEIIFNFS